MSSPILVNNTRPVAPIPATTPPANQGQINGKPVVNSTEHTLKRRKDLENDKRGPMALTFVGAALAIIGIALAAFGGTIIPAIIGVLLLSANVKVGESGTLMAKFKKTVFKQKEDPANHLNP
jgi:hypothetical protein